MLSREALCEAFGDVVEMDVHAERMKQVSIEHAAPDALEIIGDLA